MDIFDPCSTTRTLLNLWSFCDRFLLMFKLVLLIWAGGSGNNGYATSFGAGNEHGKVDPGSKVDGLLGLTEWA